MAAQQNQIDQGKENCIALQVLIRLVKILFE